MYEVAADGSDSELDSILFRLHLETACRRGGALALQPDDLNPLEYLIRLREKGGTDRWQPVSLTLMGELCCHRDQRIPTKVLPQKPVTADRSAPPPTGDCCDTATTTRPLSATTTSSGAESESKSLPRQPYTPAHIGCDTPL
ncbi:hypothetical protein [Nocardia terpenica]|uniref:hypothetical protein n=1 Tax=Nocardia terpenica TaxID=455432 RepID=UPI002FE3F4A4